MVKVYGETLLDPLNEVLYNSVVENCIAEFEDDTAMPEPTTLDDHLRTLFNPDDPTFGGLPEPIKETIEPDPSQDASPDASTTEGPVS